MSHDQGNSGSVKHPIQRMAVSGATGMVGQALIATAGRTDGHVGPVTVVPFVRPGRGDSAKGILWDPSARTIEQEKLEGLDAVVHLAGESIAEGRWNDAKKQRILDSRVQGTRLISESLAKCRNKPRVLVSASAIGFYGHRGDALLGEETAAGAGYLPDVCRAWEDATEPAERAGIRVVHLRIGIVLSTKGGALKKMLTPFRLGLGGRVGSGGQYWSWISLDDLVGAIWHCLEHDELSGAVNAVAPDAPTNREFTAALAKALHRPAIFPMPAFAARLALGEMADSLLLCSSRVAPLKLEQSHYRFHHRTLDAALADILKKG